MIEPPASVIGPSSPVPVGRGWPTRPCCCTGTGPAPHRAGVDPVAVRSPAADVRRIQQSLTHRFHQPGLVSASRDRRPVASSRATMNSTGVRTNPLLDGVGVEIGMGQHRGHPRTALLKSLPTRAHLRIAVQPRRSMVGCRWRRTSRACGRGTRRPRLWSSANEVGNVGGARRHDAVAEDRTGSSRARGPARRRTTNRRR
jgi:hypothetical protein